MKRRRVHKGEVAFQLFSFLDVLLCTLGGLIIMLTIVIHRARAQAVEKQEQLRTEAAAEVESNNDEIARAKEEQEWRRQMLEDARAESLKKLSNQRLELSHLEDHIHRLETRWKQLIAEAQKLQEIQKSRGSNELAAKEELAELLAAVEQARKELDKAKADAAGKRRGFAIVPYVGPNGTRRRPIYIECTQQSVTIQPEGIVFTPEDFEGLNTAGNPLDSALRATREYLARNGDTKVNGEPYPLLIVRPDGAIAYAAARSAMKSWDDDFGYELVNEDMEIAYPKPDQALVEQLHRSVAEARQRQQILAAAMPNQRASKSRGLVASKGGGGGFVMEDEADMPGERWGSGGGSGSRSSSGGHGSMAGTASPAGFNRGSGDVAGGASGIGSATGAGVGNNSPNRPSPGDFADGTNGSFGSSGGGEPGVSGDPGDPNQISASAGELSATGSRTNSKSNSADTNRQRGSNSNRSGTGTSGGSGTGAPPGTLTKLRGAGSSNGSQTGVTRPIEVMCYANRIVVMPETGNRMRGQEIPIGDRTTDSIEPLMKVIRARVDSWGLAMAGGYWRPVLNVQVAPDAERQFDELKAVLDGSGIDIKRKK